MPRAIINLYPSFKRLNGLIEKGEYVTAIRDGLNFLRHVGQEFVRKRVYDLPSYDGDDFFTGHVEQLLAKALRHESTPIECVESVQNEIAEIESMEAYNEYSLIPFQNIHEAIGYRLASAELYLKEIDKQIATYSWEYKQDIDNGQFELYCSLSKYGALDELLMKKIEYLRDIGEEEQANAVIQEYYFMPSISLTVVDELMNAGKEEEALAAIDKILTIFKEDGYTASSQLHLRKALLLEKKGDIMGVAEEYRRIFRQHLSNKQFYFDGMKAIVPKGEWGGFVLKVFQDIPHITDEDCTLVCDLIVQEMKYSCLLQILKQNRMSFERVSIFKQYARYMPEEHQKEYTDFILDDLRSQLSHARSHEYGFIVDEIERIYSTCRVAKVQVRSFLEEIVGKYSNRRALMRALGVN